MKENISHLLNTKKIIVLILIIFCSSIIWINKKPQTKFIASDEESSFIAAYINGEISKILPSKNDGYAVEKVVCDNDAVGKWDDDKWGLLTTNLTKRTKCNIYFKKIVAHKFDYTGSEQIFTAEATGIYKLETWGAQGNSSTLGYGAYANGTVVLNKGDKLYITVGGNTSTTTGGYNGGGTGNHGGGGATHIAKVSGLLSTLSSNKSNILIVSGGGGGAGQSGSGGSAGGIEGTRGITGYCPDGTLKGGYGGTQTAGGSVVATDWAQVGSFGRGGNAIQNQTGGAGGSGYFGGGAGTSGSCYGGGGGGSSYIGNSLLSDKVMYCYNCTTSNDTNIKTISTTCNEETPTENCAKKGNGYAKITLQHIVEYEYYVNNEKVNDAPDKIYYDFVSASCVNGSSVTWDSTGWNVVISQVKSNDTCKFNFKDKKIYEFAYTGNEQIYTVFKSGIYKLETWGAQGGSASLKGGSGAYSKGTVSLTEGNKLYINVGSTTKDGTGGYNGGGTVTNNKYGGGGATHIAIKSGLLSTLANTKENILIVAAGGGGEGNGYAGGSGGGVSGNNGTGDDPGKGGTQSSGGAAGKLGSGAGTFGQGGSGSWSSESLGGGGGGYYGGSSGGGNNNNGSGGGGSGYIGNTLLTDKAMYCYNCTESSEESTKTVTITCSEEQATENCAKIGNGYVKITYLGNVNIEYYADNIKIDKTPNSSTYNFNKIDCQNGSNLTWNSDKWEFAINNYQENDTCKIYFSSKTTIELTYTGVEERIVVPKTGIYKLETWGAQGGSINKYIGGYGAYSVGTISLTKNQELYVNVGGAGSNTDVGGYNGGGHLTTGQHQYGSSGGGATHIATISGLLSTLESKKDNILIVSGGGGGANYRSENYGEGNGGAGGGIIGVNGTSTNHTNGYGYGYGTGGSQTAGGSAVWNKGTATTLTGSNGVFGSAGVANNTYLVQAGAGGGYYGGGSGSHGGSGGGSSYIGNSLLKNKSMYCYNCTESSKESTKTVTTTCNEETPTENCAKKGMVMPR